MQSFSEFRDFLCINGCVQFVFVIRMAGVYEEEFSFAVEGAGIHGDGFLFEEASHFFVSSSGVQDGGAEEGNFAHFVSVQVLDEFFHMAIDMACIDAASQEEDIYFLFNGYGGEFCFFAKFPGYGSGNGFGGAAAGEITDCGFQWICLLSIGINSDEDGLIKVISVKW